MKHVLQAVGDFTRRYATVFRAAWAVRTQLDPPQRSADELAFLPAHLELTDTPVSPLPRWIMRAIIAFFCIALLWACFGKLDIVAVAQGKTVVGSRTKIIQSAETAVVKRIWVRDGQVVKQGELLIELDATGTGADYAKAGDALIDARLAELRFAALSQALDSRQAPVLAPDTTLPPERFSAEQRMAASQFATYQARQQSLLASIEQRSAELETVQSLIGPLTEGARIAKERSADYAKLLERSFVSRQDYVLREQERMAAERDLTAQLGRLQETRSAQRSAREELRVLSAEMRQQTLDGLRQAREQVQQLAPEVAKTGQRDHMMQLRAPVDGTVQQLAVHTIGGVVTPAQPLLAVVPSEEALEIEATVLNKDIGFVRPGQAVTVKVESFPYTRYGYLTGTVETISHDAAQDEKLGLVFPARVKLHSAMLNIDGVQVRITPGMALSVEIKTGQRRVIDYVLSPLRVHGGEAFKER